MAIGPDIDPLASPGEWLPERMFQHAIAFELAAAVIGNGIDRAEDAELSGGPNFIGLCIAYAVNSAFAVELYLKTLIHLTTGVAAKKDHNLLKLYRQLSADYKCKVSAQFVLLTADDRYDFSGTTIEPPDTTDVEAVLERQATTFESVRYLFEKPDGSADYFQSNNLEVAVSRVILDARPGWSKYVAHLGR